MISIIVPIYNASQYLDDCIISILNQSYKDIELILVNDGSIDRSLEICNSYSDSRVIVIDKTNEGVSATRNRGINVARGEYITFVDSDDTLPNDALNLLYTSIVCNNVDMSCGPFIFQYKDNFIPHSHRFYPGKYKYKDYLNTFIDDGTLSGFLIGSVCGALYKTKIIKDNKIEFNSKIKNNEDGLFNLEYAIRANEFAVIDGFVYNYRQYENSSSSVRNKDYDFNSQIRDFIIDKYDTRKFEIEKQFHRRDVSLALWDILNFPMGMSFFLSIKYVKKRIGLEKVRIGLEYIQKDKLTKYKRLFYYLIKYKFSLIICIIVKYLIPFWSSRISR